ncbi:hypothetical protein FHT86_002197 [Rhizobium sp. BK313]|uniref:hypothetical protein n=1 Tax=Rhizobium sp. BK313 TaxID=2587081 RepID=UPI00162110C3|nr:hypothetical protein [Rhizobium sp. BK313]MBB3453941.1 hypothetical protein [Rhizobium sp. BK313]
MSLDDFYCSRTVKAIRKPHECEQCGRQIDVGSPAEYGAGKYDGYFYARYQHIECRAAGMAYAEATGLWGEDFTWFQHADSDQRDDIGEWLLEHHPIVAERINYQREEVSA